MRINPNDAALHMNRLNSDNKKINENKTAELNEAAAASFGNTLGAARMDRVSIGNKEMSDDDFIRELAGSISAEVKAGKPQNVLNDIKMQIALGEYDINADDIASKILGEGK